MSYVRTEPTRDRHTRASTAAFFRDPRPYRRQFAYEYARLRGFAADLHMERTAEFRRLIIALAAARAAQP